MKTAAKWLVLTSFLTGLADVRLSATAAETVPVGVARIDITPDHPVRLAGYANRQTESEGVSQRIWAKALAIGGARETPVVLVMVENLGVSAAMTAQVAAQLGLKPECLAVCATHIHTAPWLAGMIPLHSVAPIPAEHQERMKQYTARLTQLMVQVAQEALAARKPAILSWTQGSVGFAMNRRPIKDGRVTGIGVNREGAVDHSLPMLRVSDPDGKLVAVVLNYACHGTTLGGRDGKIHGDWAGCAQPLIEADHPGAMALICVGCGGDANPEPRGTEEIAAQHGRAVADEVTRLLRGAVKPVSPRILAKARQIQLPLDGVPSREELERRVAAGNAAKPRSAERQLAKHASAMLQRLEQGPLPTSIDYQVTTWTFGDDLEMVFLPGEVCVDYALRLKKELDGSRLWITAYANDLPCYIVTRRILQEGGYEPDSALSVYGLPAKLAPAVEDLIVETVKSLVPASLAAGR